MPNWCENTLTIKASTSNAMKDYNRLESLFEDSLKIDKDTGYVDNLFDSIIPMPKELLGTEAPKDKPNWYNWCIDNWGTKWDACDCFMATEQHEEHNEIEFSFNTAWSPPIPWLEKVGAIFPNLFLWLSYDEPGNCFRGVACGIGKIVDKYEEYE